MDLPDPLFRQLKAKAALQGISLKKLILRLIENDLKKNETSAGKKRLKFPLIPSRKPGSIQLTGEKISMFLEDEDMHVSS